ncbi:MAG: hypothetical protein ACRDSK_02515 [Actinophytocola sp.]|uniref:hypothetical protein n=1 Tax=Actinophytocola sp. TaxID=1872138 RepID=UPI003D6ABF7A
MPTDDDWHRGFAEPDLADEYPRPRATSPKPARAGFEGTDDHGVIKVLVDGSGAVVDVVIPSTWQDTIASRELGVALRTAANNAFFSWLADGLANADLEQRPVSARSPEAGGPPSGEVSASLVDEVDELIAKYDRDLRTYRERLRAASATATATTCGVNGRIEVTMQPRHVSEVTVDTRWIQYARYTEVRAEAVAAFKAACRQAGTGQPDAVALPASIARMRELASDPRALSRQLGLS